MAVSTTISKTAKVPGSQRRTVSTVTLDSSYAENGEPLTAAELGLSSVDYAHCQLLTGSEAEAVDVGWANYNVEKSLLEVYEGKSQKQMAATKNLEKVKVQVIAFGI